MGYNTDMRIDIKATNISITPSIVEYVDKKVNMLEKFFRSGEDVLINVEVGKISKHHKSGEVFRAEIRIASSGRNCYAAVEADNLYAAIDEVKDEVAHELNSSRKRAIDLIRRGGAKIKNLLKGWRNRG